MNSEKLVTCGYDMLYLASCALHGKVPAKEIVAAMDLQAVYKLAVYQSMQSVTYMGLESCLTSEKDVQLEIAPELLAKWKESKAKVIRKNIMFDIERDKILSFMEKQGIWYMPLKGILLQHFYPKPGMRQMADNDILFDGEYRDAVRKYMVDNGYSVYCYGKGIHDVYQKEPFYNFEMHISLHRKSTGEAKYYEDVKSRLIKDEGNGYGYHFSDEDFYIYCITHTYKHFSNAGNGVRFFMDIYLYQKKLGDCLDWEYITTELDRLGLKDFESQIRLLACRLFSEDCRNYKNAAELLTEKERETVVFCLSSGTYGTMDNAVQKRLEIAGGNEQRITFGTRIKYCWYRVFPKMEFYRENYPFYYKHKGLIPFFVLYRGFRTLFKRHKKLIAEFKTVWKRF